MSFLDYLTNVRIEEAIRLLNGQSDTIKEVAAKVGYKDIKQFRMVFKKYTGLTPSEYIQKRKAGL